jgi:hypothetical protein
VGGCEEGKIKKNANTELTGKKNVYNTRTTNRGRKKAMTKGKALNGKPDAGNPHVRFDEGEVVSAATPRRGSLLYIKIIQGDITTLAVDAIVNAAVYQHILDLK